MCARIQEIWLTLAKMLGKFWEIFRNRDFGKHTRNARCDVGFLRYWGGGQLEGSKSMDFRDFDSKLDSWRVPSPWIWDFDLNWTVGGSKSVGEILF